jgi:hypothetical protein
MGGKGILQNEANSRYRSRELVDWAQRTLPDQNRLTPILSKRRKFASRRSLFASIIA